MIHSEVNPIGQCRETESGDFQGSRRFIQSFYTERGARPTRMHRSFVERSVVGFSSQDWGYFSTRQDGQLPRRSPLFPPPLLRPAFAASGAEDRNTLARTQRGLVERTVCRI
ncbi:hypothetical protein QQF64_005771 [Cirrhinus molitorella]|uniref:Uncharacterized protein n=1 Tax=Cirrhinus molitorella TaxID=172907 RepID=A0ABR3MD80_9TELE